MEGGLLANSSYAVLCCVTVIIGWLLHWTYRWVYPPCKGRLPPGSMGIPIIGETLQYIHEIKQALLWTCQATTANDTEEPLIVSLDPEFNWFIFQQEGKLFRSWFPDAGKSIIGDKSVTAFTGNVHKFIRSFASKLFGFENIKGALIQELEDTMKEGFVAWAAKPSIEVNDAITDMLFNLVAKKIISFGPEESRELRQNFKSFMKGIVSFPIYFPGTSFYKAMKGRRIVHKKLSDLLRDRLSTPEKKHGDLLDLLVEELQSEKPVVDEAFSIDVVAGFLLAGFAPISKTLTVALKLLSDNPEVIETLKEEHEAILKKREDRNSGFTWEEYKSMTFTTQVVNEITRIGVSSIGIFRKALTDVQVNGYTIPAGWLVMISPTAAHQNPSVFEDPLKFNPWRWTDETKRSIQQRNLMPFGGGMRLCAGAEFSKLFISLFLHVLVPKYRWIEIKGGGVTRVGESLIPQDHHIQIVPRS